MPWQRAQPLERVHVAGLRLEAWQGAESIPQWLTGGSADPRKRLAAGVGVSRPSVRKTSSGEEFGQPRHRSRSLHSAHTPRGKHRQTCLAMRPCTRGKANTLPAIPGCTLTRIATRIQIPFVFSRRAAGLRPPRVAAASSARRRGAPRGSRCVPGSSIPGAAAAAAAAAEEEPGAPRPRSGPPRRSPRPLCPGPARRRAMKQYWKSEASLGKGNEPAKCSGGLEGSDGTRRNRTRMLDRKEAGLAILSVGKYYGSDLQDSERGAYVCGQGGSWLMLVVATHVSCGLCFKLCKAVVQGVMHINQLSPAVAKPPADIPDVPVILSSLCCTKPFPARAGDVSCFG
ncbi:uncharacterized protein LOC142420080 [Mycteria americana]|uniref:uncharacterized protein LOC142420080 n=1 Tax=Mycteria americana TaxID=33587 RepID=UPI003F58E58C